MKISLSQVVCAAGFAVLVLTSGCDTTPARHPRTTQRIVLKADQIAPEVALEVISAVEIVLPPAAAGCVWEISSNDNRILEQMDSLKAGDPLVALGPPTTLVSFYALKPGRSVLRFVMVRPGEAETVPVAKCQVTVRVSD
ncbi:MAG TPA: protease inhibitor I42 family protein [Opitutaceae bacterium]